MSPGRETNPSYLITKTPHEDYKQPYSLDVLGLDVSAQGDQGSVYHEFKEQLTMQKNGHYENSPPSRDNHPELPTNYQVAKRRSSP